MMQCVRYTDLEFVLHGFVSATEADNMRRVFRHQPGGEAALPVVIERAIAKLPNGRCVSVLRGMKTAGVEADFETCRLFGCNPGLEPIKHKTEESVQAELDAVAALPPIALHPVRTE